MTRNSSNAVPRRSSDPSRAETSASCSFCFPFNDGDEPIRDKFGELAIAAAEPNDDIRLVLDGGLKAPGENMPEVGLPGRDLLGWEGLVTVEDDCRDSPEAASVRRNSTQSREKDCIRGEIE